MTYKVLQIYWDYVSSIADDYGYDCWHHNNVSQGIGTIMSKEDRFVPIINLGITPELVIDGKVVIPAEISFIVEDRNGNSILSGETCAVHRLKDCEDFEVRLEAMCKYVFDKYSQYSRENRFDFVFNEYEKERIEWNKREIEEV